MFFSRPPFYHNLCSYIEGCDFVLGGKILPGFAKHLMKLKAPKNLHWSAGFLWMLFGSQEEFPWVRIQRDEAADKMACEKLVRELVKFASAL